MNADAIILTLIGIIQVCWGAIVWALWTRTGELGGKIDGLSVQLGSVRENYVKREDLASDMRDIKDMLKEISKYTHKSVHKHNNRLHTLVLGMARVNLKLGLPPLRDTQDDEQEDEE